MTILKLLANDNYIIVNRDLAKELGLEEAIIFGELASEYNYYEKNNQLEDGYFYSTIDNIEDNTTLSEYKQRKALNNLKDIGLIDITIKGIPAKRYIKINEEQVEELFNIKYQNNLRTSSLKIKELELKKLKGNSNNNNNNKNNNNIYNHNDIYSYIENNFGRTLSPIEYEEIKSWRDNELTRYAIKQAVLNNKYSIKYISKILFNYSKNNIQTVQQAQEQNLQFQEKKNPVKNNNINPDWFNQESDVVAPDDKGLEEMNKLIEELSS